MSATSSARRPDAYEDVKRELEEAASLTCESSAESVKGHLQALCAQQHRLEKDARHHVKNGYHTADKVALTERVAEAVGRLMDLAASVASRQLRAGTAASTPEETSMKTASAELKASFMEGPPEIDPEEIRFDPVHDLIGTGAFGKVYRGMCRGKQVAVKVPNKQRLTESELLAFRREVTIMRKVFHPNVVLFLGACTKPGHQIMIVTELMRGDVEGLIHPPTEEEAQKRPSPTLLQRLRICYDAALGINWLHGICQIVHRDLKPANLLLDESGHVKVTDFGFSEIIRRGEDESGGVAHNRDVKGPKGTALYMAPEVMRLEEFGTSSDVHSFGMILYETTTGIEPFTKYTDLRSFAEAVCVRDERPVVPPELNFPKSLVDLVTACLRPDPSLRSGFPEIVRALERIIVEVGLNNDSARAFWLRYFVYPLKDVISYHGQLVPALSAVLPGTPPETFAALERMIVGEQQFVQQPGAAIVWTDTMTLERFNQTDEWFGQWYWHRDILEEMLDLSKQEWFHNDIGSPQACARLRLRNHGTFLLRLSFTDTSRTPFTLSRVLNGQFDHKRVYRLSYDTSSEARFAVQVDPSQDPLKAASLPDLVKLLLRHHHITEPCPRNAPKAGQESFY